MSPVKSLRRLLVCESEAVIGRGLEALLREAFPHCAVDVLTDADSLLESDFDPQPDTILLGYSSGINYRMRIPKEVRLRMPGTRILTLLGKPEDIWEALPSESDGYALREMSAAELSRGLYSLADGHCFMGASLSEYLLRGQGWQLLQSSVQRAQIDDIGLSARERDVLKLIAEGRQNNEIAQHLGLSLQTVKVHVKHILRKLNVPDRTNAAISYMGGMSLARTE